MKVYLQRINKRYYAKFQKPDGKWTARALKGEGEEKATTSKVRAKLLLGDIAKQVEAEYATPLETGQSDVTVQQLISLTSGNSMPTITLRAGQVFSSCISSGSSSSSARIR